MTSIETTRKGECQPLSIGMSFLYGLVLNSAFMKKKFSKYYDVDKNELR